jgi:hypothetical protein
VVWDVDQSASFSCFSIETDTDTDKSTANEENEEKCGGVESGRGKGEERRRDDRRGK